MAVRLLPAIDAAADVQACVLFFATRRASTTCAVSRGTGALLQVSVSRLLLFRHAKDVFYGAVCAMSVSAAIIFLAKT